MVPCNFLPSHMRTQIFSATLFFSGFTAASGSSQINSSSDLTWPCVSSAELSSFIGKSQSQASSSGSHYLLSANWREFLDYSPFQTSHVAELTTSPHFPRQGCSGHHDHRGVNQRNRRILPSDRNRAGSCVRFECESPPQHWTHWNKSLLGLAFPARANLVRAVLSWYYSKRSGELFSICIILPKEKADQAGKGTKPILGFPMGPRA